MSFIEAYRLILSNNSLKEKAGNFFLQYEFKNYYMQRQQSISQFPKIYLACCSALAVLVFSKSLDPYAISYTFTQTFFQLSLWRPITAMFYVSRIGLIFPFQLAFAYLATYKMANQVYRKQSTADLVWLLIISMILLMLFSSLIANLYFYANSFIMILLMMWAMQYPTDPLNIFGAYIQSVYWPIIYCVTMIALGSSYKNYMAGLLIGLVIGTIKSPNFIRQHKDFLPTPTFLKSFFRFDAYQAQMDRIQQIRHMQQSRDENNEYFRGTGYRLG